MEKFFEKNLLIKNFNNNKNLLLLTGNMRTFRYLLKYHKKFLDHTKSDLIISTWSDADCDIEFVKMVKETLKPIYFEIEDYNFNITTDIFGKFK